MKKNSKGIIKVGNLGLSLMILIFLLAGLMLYSTRTGRRGLINNVPNKNNCLADECLLIENLEYPVSKLSKSAQTSLEEAINDEYKALTLYQKITTKLGTVRPFSMIIGAEEQHISSLRALFNKYGISIPQNNWSGKVTAPKTLIEACQLGVDAEKANAKLYKEKLLPLVVDYEDITLIFTNLMNASNLRHLPSFERCN